MKQGTNLDVMRPAPLEAATLHIRPNARRGGNLLVDLPIGARLTLGFLLAALIASLVSGAIGLQNAKSLRGQATFYQTLLKSNTKLTTGASFLQLMNAEVHTILATGNAAQTSNDTLKTEKENVAHLADLYNNTLNDYANNDLLTRHLDLVALLAEANHEGQVKQQSTLQDSAARTWSVYRTAQTNVIDAVNNGQWAEAAHIEQVQGEFMNADSSSALKALIRFNERLALSVQDAANVEGQTQLILTIVGSVIAFVVIILIGWLISGTIVTRLRQLRQVTQAVEQGQLDRRITVVGRDEIADVSASVNAMLTAIVGLLEESRNQRDALTNAAEHLFSDMRVVSAGDLRINAPVSNDPIGMLANAFNFTVGRFRRFVQRTKGTAEQLDVIVRQEIERAEVFSQAIHVSRGTSQTTMGQMPTPTSQLGESRTGRLNPHQSVQFSENEESQQASLMAQVKSTREHLQQISGDGVARHTRAVITLGEQISASISRLNKSMIPHNESQSRYVTTDLINMQVRELRMLETVLKRMTTELQNVQNNTAKGLQELDNDLIQISTAVRTFKPKGGAEISSTELSEIVKLNTAFASDVVATARQVAILAQEIRAGIIAFQLDTVESGNALVGNAPLSLAPGYNLAADMQQNQPKPGNSFPGFNNPQFGPNDKHR